uniref:Uncharacterized protein n=1 Tax=Rhizophora mucronata TaxID=61149 RepID=A0A2P2QJG3_RHIMU
MNISALDEVALTAPSVGQPILATTIFISGNPIVDNAVTRVS